MVKYIIKIYVVYVVFFPHTLLEKICVWNFLRGLKIIKIVFLSLMVKLIFLKKYIFGSKDSKLAYYRFYI